VLVRKFGASVRNHFAVSLAQAIIELCGNASTVLSIPVHEFVSAAVT
jgi:hypothetical protein